MSADDGIRKTAQTLIDRLSDGFSRDPDSLAADIALVTGALDDDHAAQLTTYQQASLRELHGQLLLRSARSADACVVFDGVVDAYADDDDVRVRHEVDVARTYLAEALLLDRGDVDRGVAVVRDIETSFVRSERRHKPFKAMMLIDLTHAALAIARRDLVAELCETLIRESDGGAGVAADVRAQALFYLAQTKVVDGHPMRAEPSVAALMSCGEPGLEGLDRIRQRFGSGETNKPWVTQVDLCRAIILHRLGRRDEARVLWDDVRAWSSELRFPAEFLEMADEIGREL